jgi:hypothetical protein
MMEHFNTIVKLQEISVRENDVWVMDLKKILMNLPILHRFTFIYFYNSQSSLRTQGQAEYAGIIQVTDLNDIEPWTGGKPEFTIVVMNANGVIIGKKKFPKKRSNFKDEKWYDYNYLGN